MKKTKTVKTVEAELWNVFICDGIMSMIHGSYESLREYYIPKHDISFNIHHEKLNVFRPHKGRYAVSETITNQPMKFGNVKISKDFVESLEKYLILNEELLKKAIKIAKDHDKPIKRIAK